MTSDAFAMSCGRSYCAPLNLAAVRLGFQCFAVQWNARNLPAADAVPWQVITLEAHHAPVLAALLHLQPPRAAWQAFSAPGA